MKARPPVARHTRPLPIQGVASFPEPTMPNTPKPTTPPPEEAEVEAPKHISTIDLPGNGDAARLWRELRAKGGK